MRYIVLLMLFLAGCGSVTANVVLEEKSSEPEVLFCPQDGCMDELIKAINSAEKVECAFMQIQDDELENVLREKKASVVIDEKYPLDFAIINHNPSLMHNKFCVLDDEIVWTGSFNPTFNGNNRNNNNVIIIRSENLARLYSNTFAGLLRGGSRTRSSRNKMIFNNKSLEVYFCPEDWCGNKIMKRLENAKESIYFMTFSFTHDGIGEMLIEKHEEGIVVSGIMEKTQENDFCEYYKLKEKGIDVIWDKNPNKMHHKVFIIDEKIVITGSFNPSNNADYNNDENILIIEDKRVAGLFLDEFERMKVYSGRIN